MIPKISPTHYFKLSNGQIIKHISELPDSIDRMPVELFNEYVNYNKNDFAKWAYDVFRFKDLAILLKSVKSKEESSRILRAYLQKKSQNYKILNSQEVIQIKKQESKEISQNKTEQEPKRYTWNSQKPIKVQEKKEIIEPVSKKEIIQKVVIEEKNVQHNVTQKNVSEADKYFDENPVLVSQMVDTKKKNIQLEKVEKIEFTNLDMPEKVIELFKDTYTKAYEKLVLLRKNGFDTKIVQLMLFRIPSRIKIYEAAKEKKEAIQINRYLNEVIDELNAIYE
ncbi:hypothetical protein HN789_04910 [archaeon]|jgi:hypothetical protein|nr:hypothetical protein [archaeon]MBT4022389.1 hypothetical protein [archaeon]MBT4273267.1 hypothetical protein [archaeon]MBT4461290.1 hypothetical protein [archaeon]MBT4858587.1 hypothetical protein [archaeon]